MLATAEALKKILANHVVNYYFKNASDFIPTLLHAVSTRTALGSLLHYSPERGANILRTPGLNLFNETEVPYIQLLKLFLQR